MQETTDLLQSHTDVAGLLQDEHDQSRTEATLVVHVRRHIARAWSAS